MSKMGISTYMSYTGSQIFEAVGLAKSLVDKYFTGTTSNVEGIGVFDVAEEAIRVHRAAFGEDDPVMKTMLDAGGEYAWRVRGEEHAWTPEAIAKLQHSARANSYSTYKEYAALINDQKSTRLNSSHEWISYAVFCLKKKIKRRGELPERLRFRLTEDLRYSYPGFSENGSPATAKLAPVCVLALS